MKRPLSRLEEYTYYICAWTSRHLNPRRAMPPRRGATWTNIVRTIGAPFNTMLALTSIGWLLDRRYNACSTVHGVERSYHPRNATNGSTLLKHLALIRGRTKCPMSFGQMHGVSEQGRRPEPPNCGRKVDAVAP